MPRRRARRRFGAAVAGSLALHALAVLAMTLSRGAVPPPQERIYAVDIVSPPPNVAGERPTSALAEQQPAPAEPAPEPVPEPPAPEPDPVPPPRPEPAPPKEQPKQRESPKEQPKAREPAKEAPKQQTPPARPATTPTTGTGTQAQPAAGRTPQPTSPGGEGVRVHTPGDPCPVAGYCENVSLTVNRFFRPPGGSAGATGEVCFRILRDGGVADIRVQGMRNGSPSFRLAMMEAAEAAGQRRAFGALPAAFDPQRWSWCVELSPS